MVERRHVRRPAGLDDDGLVVLDDEGRAGHAMARREVCAAEDCRIHPLAVEMDFPDIVRTRCAARGRRRGLGCAFSEACRRCDFDGFHDDILVLEAEAELRLVRLLETCDCGGSVTGREIRLQRRVAAVIAQVKKRRRLDLRFAHALRGEFSDGFLREFRNGDVEFGRESFVERPDDGAGARGSDAREAYAVSREKAREGVDVDGLHAEGVRDETGMLAARTAEAGERIGGDIVAAFDRDFLDGIRHVLDGNAEEALCDLFRGAAADLCRQSGKACAHNIGVERRILLRPKDMGKKIGLQLPEHDVGVRYGERPAAAVAGRTGIGPGRGRADLKAAVFIMENRAATRRDGVNAHHGHAHAHARDFGFEAALIFAIEMRYVRRGAAHVEADHLREARFGSRHRSADNAACRAGEDCVLALEERGIGEAPGGLHEEEPRFRVAGADGARYAVDIAPQQRREIGVHYRRVAARNEFHERAHTMADRHLREADLAGEGGGFILMGGIAIAMHEANGDGADTFCEAVFKRTTRGLAVERGQHFS